jgi:hypothetical protein
MTILSDIHRCCAKGFCGSCTTSQCPSSSSCFSSFIVDYIGCLEVDCSVSYGILYHTLVVSDL